MNRDEIARILHQYNTGTIGYSTDINAAAGAIARLVESRIKHLTITLTGARKYVAKMKADGVETVLSPKAMLERIDEALDGVEK